MKKVNIAELADAIDLALTSYAEQLTEDVKDEVKAVAKNCLAEIKAGSPVADNLPQKGRYKKGWTATTLIDSGKSLSIVIHNKTDYWLTHLLEFGHLSRNGGWVAAQPHIAAPEEKAVNDLQNKVKVVISK